MKLKTPTLSDIKRANQRIQKFIIKTPILVSHSTSDMVSTSLCFKGEIFKSRNIQDA